MAYTIVTNAKNVAETISKANDALNSQQVVLFRSLGGIFVRDVQERIKSQNKGQWAGASKWVQAKKGGEHKILQGAEEYVKSKADIHGMTLYGETPGEWTLSQHDEGFENEVEQIGGDGRIEIDIVNPGPLGLKPGTTKFAWVPKNLSPDHTPARQIWPLEADAIAIITPAYSRWVQATLTAALEGSGAKIEATAL